MLGEPIKGTFRVQEKKDAQGLEWLCFSQLRVKPIQTMLDLALGVCDWRMKQIEL